MANIPALAIRQANDEVPGTVPRISAGNQLLISNPNGTGLVYADPSAVVAAGTTLYMPPPNGANDLPAFLALVSELTGVGGTIQFRSGTYKSPTGFVLDHKEGIHVRGVSSSVSGTPSTLLSWTGPRAAHSACFRILAGNSCSVSDMGMLATVSGPENGILIGGDGSNDASTCYAFDVQCYGNAAAAPVATCATSINVATCINTTVAITLSAVAVPFTIGTRLLLISRGGRGILEGAITASSGAAVSFVPVDAFGSGSHTDWDVLQPMNGVNIGSSELCAIYRSSATLCYQSFKMGGVGGYVDASCSTSSPLGPSFRSDSSSSYVKIFGNAESNAQYPNNVTVALFVDTVLNFEASIGLGDNHTYGPPFILRNVQGGALHNINAQSTVAGESIVSVNTCFGLSIRSVYGGMSSGFFVLNQGTCADCSVDGLYDAVGTMNTFSGGFAGFVQWYDVAAAAPKLNFNFFKAQNLEAQLGVTYPPGAMSCGNGANPDLSLNTAFNILTGPTGAFQISGFAPPTNGLLITFAYLGAQSLTLQHANAGSTAGNRLLCPGGVDATLAGPCVFRALYSASAGAWLIMLPSQAPPLSGTVTLTAGVSAAISAANLTANSRILVTLKTPSGTSLTVNYAALASDRSVGTPGSFKVTALIAAGTINTADASTLDWLVIS